MSPTSSLATGTKPEHVAGSITQGTTETASPGLGSVHPLVERPRSVSLFRIVVNGRGRYYGFFQHACDAISDALENGASSVSVAKAA